MRLKGILPHCRRWRNDQDHHVLPSRRARQDRLFHTSIRRECHVVRGWFLPKSQKIDCRKDFSSIVPTVFTRILRDFAGFCGIGWTRLFKEELGELLPGFLGFFLDFQRQNTQNHLMFNNPVICWWQEMSWRKIVQNKSWKFHQM